MAHVVATFCFGVAILHTFLVKRFQHIAHRYPSGSVGENFFHLVGEVEVVFGFWAGVYLIYLIAAEGHAYAIEFLEGRDFIEPVFVFVIMTVCSTRPILDAANWAIEKASHVLPFKKGISFYISALIIGPLLGSFITEPAAMTVTALVLLERYYARGMSDRLKYLTLGVLFVNVSIGGTLTPFAAPPILMVAPKWNWDVGFMIAHFGWKGMLACAISVLFVALTNAKELGQINPLKNGSRRAAPIWVIVLHLIALLGIVASSHHQPVFFGIFLFFLGLVTVTKEYQSELKLREALLVAFFLGGLVVLGAPQRWWLEPLLAKLDSLSLFLGATGLTAITDNAALTYLGSQVPGLSDSAKYALVAGAVVGGGLTVIANAPNPAGYGILNSSFGEEGISPLRLFLGALIPTVIAACCFWFL